MTPYPNTWTQAQKARFDVYLPYLKARRLMDETPCIHVAGTNGKGSVCAMLESMLRQAGYRTGLFTSPHLYRETERIRLNGEPISQADMQRGMDEVGAVLPDTKYFERTFFCAMEAFANARCEIAVIEAGIGGAMDVTNLVQPAATVIANIGLDHTALLGDTIEHIAAQKAGIAKPGVPMVVYPALPGAARAVIENTCRAVGAPVLPAGRVTVTQEEGGLAPLLTFETEHGTVGPVTLPLLGAHQQKNAQTALCAMEAVAARFPSTARQKEQGLARTDWPGRMQWYPGCKEGVPQLIDGAHNPQAAAYLRENVRALFGHGPVVLLCAVMRDKNAAAVAKELDALADTTVCTVAEPGRGLAAEQLAALFTGPAKAEQDPTVAYQKAIELARDQGALLVIAGSLYLPGAIGLGREKERV